MQSELDGDYEVFRDVPIFDEHTGDDGVTYDKRRLQCIADNNNFRINDTNDWCPIVAGHTPGEDGAQQPPIVGYAGPFKVSIIGNVDPRHCIFTDFRVHKDHADTFRANPRRSVELWPEDDPDNRFFDPIAILGAECPKRALGLTRYAARSPQKQPIRYEMGAEPVTAEAGGHNTFIPGMGTKKKKKPQTYSEGEGTMQTIDPQLLAQVLEAAMPQIQAMIADQMGNLMENDAPLQAEPAAELDPAMPVEGAEPMIPDNAPPADPLADPVAPVIDEGPPLEGDVKIDEEPTDFSKYAKAKIAKYMCADEGEHKTDALQHAMKFANGLDDDDKAELGTMLDGDGSDDDKAFYAKMKYEMSGGEEDQMKGTSTESVEGAAKYAKAQKDNQALRARNAELEADASKAQEQLRYAKRTKQIDDLADDYVIPDDEAEHCRGLTDDQFAAHVERIPQTYQKAVGPQIASLAKSPKRESADTQADRIASIARKGVEKYNKKAKTRMGFPEAYKIVEEHGQFVEPTAAE